MRLDAVFVPPTADFDKNGVVNDADLGIWRTGFNAGGTVTPMQGDVDRNLRIDGADFLLWQQRLGGASSGASSSGVPEPGGLPLMMAAVAGIWRRRRAAMSSASIGENVRA